MAIITSGVMKQHKMLAMPKLMESFGGTWQGFHQIRLTCA